MRDDFNYWREKKALSLWLAFTKCIPAKARYWIVVEASVRATTGKFSDTVVPELTMMEMIQRINPYTHR